MFRVSLIADPVKYRWLVVVAGGRTRSPVQPAEFVERGVLGALFGESWGGARPLEMLSTQGRARKVSWVSLS